MVSKINNELTNLSNQDRIDSYENLGNKSGCYLYYNNRGELSVKRLNLIQQLLRNYFHAYSETHIHSVIQGITTEKDVSKTPNWQLLATRLNQILYKKEIESGRSLDKNESPQITPVFFRSTIKTHNFLSNFFPTLVCYNNRLFLSVEVAYQASKFENHSLYDTITSSTAREAKLIINKHRLEVPRHDISTKLKIMETIVQSKFSLNIDLKNRLIATGNRALIEHTDDFFWGDGNLDSNEIGPGKNYLGQILQTIRHELLEDQ